MLTITTTNSVTFPVTLPTGANVSEYVRTLCTQGGAWDGAVFYPIQQIQSIAYAAA